MSRICESLPGSPSFEYSSSDSKQKEKLLCVVTRVAAFGPQEVLGLDVSRENDLDYGNNCLAKVLLTVSASLPTPLCFFKASLRRRCVPTVSSRVLLLGKTATT